MNLNYERSYFSTISINRFISVFKDFPETNQIVLDSINSLVDMGRMKVFAFVIMRDHIHVVWQASEGIEILDVIKSFKQFTGREIVKYLSEVDSEYLSNFISDRADRNFKIWKESIGNILIHSLDMLSTKIYYIHNNPTKGDYKSVDNSTDYYFSSAKAYSVQTKNFKFLTILEDLIL